MEAAAQLLGDALTEYLSAYDTAVKIRRYTQVERQTCKICDNVAAAVGGRQQEINRIGNTTGMNDIFEHAKLPTDTAEVA